MVKKILPLVGFALLFISCSKKTEEPATEPEVVSQAEVPAIESEMLNESIVKQEETADAVKKTDPFFQDKEALERAESELRNLPQFKGKSINVFQGVQFYGDGRIIVKLQDPLEKDNVDQYTYRNGKWEDPEPIQLTGFGDIKGNVFPLDKIKFSTISVINSNWEAKANTVAGADEEPLKKVIYDMMWPDQWTSDDIKGVREVYKATFKLDGSVKDYVKK